MARILMDAASSTGISQKTLSSGRKLLIRQVVKPTASAPNLFNARVEGVFMINTIQGAGSKQLH
jgi:hypothetical protein